MSTQDKIKKVGQEVINLLLEKNNNYGDSALKPANIFAKGDSVENLCCRIDDKLMRIKNRGLDDSTEDTVKDLIGYLILLKIALEETSEPPTLQDWQNEILENEGFFTTTTT